MSDGLIRWKVASSDPNVASDTGTVWVWIDNAKVLHWRDENNNTGTFADNQKVLVSATDTTSEYLLDKLQAGTNITLTKTNTGGNETILIESSGSDDSDIVIDQKNANGWVDETEVSLNFSNTTRTLTVSPTASNYNYYSEGTKYTKSVAEEAVIDNTEGAWYIYYNGATLTATQTWSDDLITRYCLVAFIYWDSENSKQVLFATELHGMSMASYTHLYLHNTVGAALESGGTLGDISANDTTPTDASTQLSIVPTVIWDEDVKHSHTSKLASANIAIYYRSGLASSNIWRVNESSNLVGLSTDTGRLAWNELSGGSWSLVEANDASFVLYHIFTFNDRDRKYGALMGTHSYLTRNDAENGITSELENFYNSGLVSPEFKFLGTVILETDDSFTGNSIKSRIVSSSNDDDYVDLRSINIRTVASVSEISENRWTVSPYSENSITNRNNSDVSIGSPYASSRMFVGGGEFYAKIGSILVYTYNSVGGIFTDVTHKAVSLDGSVIDFPDALTDNALYFSSIIGVDGLHYGLKVTQTVQAVLGTGSIVFEYWNGTAWTEFNYMLVDYDDDLFLPYAKSSFTTGTGDYWILYGGSIAENWTASDPMSLGTSYKWIRCRISSTVTTPPSFESIMLAPSFMKAGGDGTILLSGKARFKDNLGINFGTFAAADNSPSSEDIYISDNVHVGRLENLFANNATDRTGFAVALPNNICTANHIFLRFFFTGNSNEAEADVDFVIRWALQNSITNNIVYNGAYAAPSQAEGEQTISSSYTMPANSSRETQFVEIPIDVSDAIAEREDGRCDVLWLTFERTYGDDYSGNIILQHVTAIYSAWKIGGRK